MLVTAMATHLKLRKGSMRRGYVVSWEAKSGNCKVVVRSKKKAQELFVLLKNPYNAELFELKDGEEIKIA